MDSVRSSVRSLRCSEWRPVFGELQKVRAAANSRVLSRRQPYSTYAVHLTTLSPPALLGDLALIYLCNKATEDWDPDSHRLAMRALFTWMFISKFIKLLGHYIRYPSDILLLPVSILFGYFHGAIKMYAAITLNVVSFPPSLFFFFFFFSISLGDAKCLPANF